MSQKTPFSTSPLDGIKIVEFQAIGPGPLAGFQLGQLGAEVTLVTRPGPSALPAEMVVQGDSHLNRAKRIVPLNLKTPAGQRAALELIGHCEGLIEGNRPGVMERLGLGPEPCAELNPRLVYGRMTGWGQEGPLASAAGHDLNYVALSGLLSLTTRPGQPPAIPPTLMGDAVGALGLTMGIACGLLAARQTGKGCVVDGAIVDVLALLAPLVQLLDRGKCLEGQELSLFHDSPFYDAYVCSDGRYITVGAIEPQFYALLLERMGLGDVDPLQQLDRTQWPALKARFALVFASRSSQYWTQQLEGTDVCFAPVLNLAEAATHLHNAARGLYALTPEGHLETARGLRFMPLKNGSADTSVSSQKTGDAQEPTAHQHESSMS